jgi:hypothetical protein
MLAQDDFEAARFDTTYLDALLRARQGEAFLPPSDTDELIVAIAAGLHAELGRGTGEGAGTRKVPAGANGEISRAAAQRWKTQARIEGLRT